VRLLFRRGAGTGGERSYRLLLDEVPPASRGTKELVIALRISLPMIAASAVAASCVRAESSCSVFSRRAPSTRPVVSVTVTNPGNQTGTVGTAASLQISASDSASGQTLTYSASGLPAGLSIGTIFRWVGMTTTSRP